MRADISRYLAKWRLELDGAPFETHSSQLAYVTRGNQRAVLKIPNPTSDEHRGAEILEHWGGPAARVLAHDAHALLIERAVPGTTLTELFAQGRDDEATEIWCDVVARLHTKPAPAGDWPNLTMRGASFNKRFSHPALPPELVDAARQEYFDLCATQSKHQVLLHADLNHYNVIRDAARGWVVIDPKGYVGELEWETATFLRNPGPHWDAVADPARIEHRVGLLVDRLHLDGTRVLRWCAAFVVLSSIWTAQDDGETADLEGPMKMHFAARALLSA